VTISNSSIHVEFCAADSPRVQRTSEHVRLSNPNKASQKTGTREPVNRALLIGMGVYQAAEGRRETKRSRPAVKVEPPTASRPPLLEAAGARVQQSRWA